MQQKIAIQIVRSTPAAYVCYMATIYHDKCHIKTSLLLSNYHVHDTPTNYDHSRSVAWNHNSLIPNVTILSI